MLFLRRRAPTLHWRKDMKLPSILKPCEEAAAWLETQPDYQTAWQNCRRPDWMIWLLNELNYNDDKVLRLYACWCVRETPLPDGRRVWDLLADSRSRAAVEMAERFAVGNASLEELRSAESAAWSAAEAAAWSAAWSAAESAARSAAESAARSAESAARSAAWSAAWSAESAAWSAQADRLREVVPFSVVEELLAAITKGC